MSRNGGTPVTGRLPPDHRGRRPLQRSEFDKLALEHLDTLYRMALHLTKRPEDASDLVQDTYTRALRASASFQEKGGGMKAWLLTIMHHAFYSNIQRKKLGPVPMGDIVAEDQRQMGPGEPPPAWDLSSLDWEHVDDRLKKAIEGLAPEHRDVLLLWGVQGLKYREIAQVLDIPIGTVMSRLHRARKLVADSLEAFREELGYSDKETPRKATPRQDA